MLKTLVFVILFQVFSLQSLFAQAREDILVQSKNSYQYGLVLPVNYNPNRRYILGICLHGLGGNGVEFAAKLSYYSRYMNMILACPNGNIPDPGRNATKWDMEKSEEYLLNFVQMIKDTYNLYPETVLIGFSQGGNFGFLMALKFPLSFPYFAGISGGYVNPEEKSYEQLEGLQVLLLSGDKGSGEIFTKKALDQKYSQLKKYKNVTRITLKGEIHEVSQKMAYSAMRWYASVSKSFKKGFWIFKGDYLRNYRIAEKERLNGNLSKAVENYRKSIGLNPIFPPAHLGYARANLLMGSLTQFKKAFFPVLEYYTLYPEYDDSGVYEMVLEFYQTIALDRSLQEYFGRFLGDKLHEHEDSTFSAYNGEIYLLLAKIYKNLNDKKEYIHNLDKAKYYFSQVKESDQRYSTGSIKEKLELIGKE